MQVQQHTTSTNSATATAYPSLLTNLNAALNAPATDCSTQIRFTKTFTSSLVGIGGWSKNFAYTKVGAKYKGRPRAIDFSLRLAGSSVVAVELELGNQTALSHDLLKLNTAYNQQRITCGAILTPTVAFRKGKRWNSGNCYLNSSTAASFLNDFGAALKVPIMILEFDI